MSGQSKIVHRIFTVIFICSLGLVFVSAPNDAYADKREKRGNKKEYRQDRRPAQTVRAAQRHKKKRFVSPRIVRRGHVVRRLPRGYKRTWFDRRPFFYNFGIFYQFGQGGFVSVRAPIGLVVESLPAGYRTVWVGASPYFAYGGVFYRRGPSGYVVVNAPSTVIVEDEAPSLVEPSYEAAGQVSVTASVLNVRSGPAKDYAVIYQIHKGYVLEIHGMETGWLYVELPNGEFGWIMKRFTTRLDQDANG